MTISEKKIELVQSLLLLQDQTALFEIEKLIQKAFKSVKSQSVPLLVPQTKIPATFEEWVAQFDDPKQLETVDASNRSTSEFRQHIWTAEQGPEMGLEEFFERVAQS